MTETNLETRHPDYKAQAIRYAEWNDFYQGGKSVEDDESYLPRHPYETEKQHKIRKQRATYRNHAAPIVTVFSSSVWEKEPDRGNSFPDALSELLEDVDRNRTSANQYFKHVTDRAAASGIHFVLVDSPKSAAQTLAEQREQGVRPYFVDVPALNLVDWGFDEKGRLSYIVIYESVQMPTEPFHEHATEERYKVWRPDSWQVWVDEGEGQERVAVLKDEGVNPLGEIPLAAFIFERGSSRMVGVSCLDDVLSLCKRVYMRDSELDKALFDAAVEIACFFGFQEDELEAFTRSSSNGLRSENTDARVEYAAPTGRVFEALRQNISDDERSIKEIALRMVRPDSKQVESADSKREDRKQLDSQLSRFSQNMADGETRCWELAAKWLGLQNVDIEVQYNDEFDTEKISGDLARSFIALRQSRDLSRETLWQILKDNGILRPDFDPVEEAARIAAEGRANPAFDRLRSQLGAEE
jgi:hypothetical protein